MTKKVILVHGWGGSPKEDWYNWLKKELIKKGYEVEAPEMPDTLNPKIDAWVGKLEEVFKESEEVYLVGHSIGCQTIMRFLEKNNIKLKKVILVAPWLSLTDETWDEDYTEEKAKPWIETPIDFDNVKTKAEKFVVVYSETDPYVPKDDPFVLKDKLGGELINMGDGGHLDREEFPEIVEEIEK
ncbi:MAG: alpha/beta hydrolase [Nanoarchaeota archaeon]|nr:alpha/beta hydrolase [Nanoarchaeota archaeon]